MMRKTKVTTTSKPLHRERWRDFFEVVFLVVILAIFIRSFILGVYRVSTNSMAPTLVTGDFIWASKTAYGIKIPFSLRKLFEKMPQKGDVVVVQFLAPSHRAKKIMRVMAHPGDHVEFKNHQLWVNGKSILMDSAGGDNVRDIKAEGRSVESTIRLIPLVVPPGEVFVMLDHREELGIESRVTLEDNTLWSLIPLEQIESQVKGIWFSLAWPTTTFNPAFNAPDNRNKDSDVRMRWDRVGIISNTF